MDRPLVAVVLAGGTGTRLYPASTPDRPKQLHGFGGEDSLLERTVARCRGVADRVYVVTRPDLTETVRTTVPGAAVLTEPEPRDTGPALVYAAVRVREQVGDCVLACLPSDHHVAGDFSGTLERAARTAVETDSLVTIGVEPDRPATEYGYVEPTPGAGGDTTAGSDVDPAPVGRFLEKPDRETAREFVERGWYWNAGMFCWTPEAFLAEARESPLADLVAAVAAGRATEGFATADPVSVDYAVLERAEDVRVVPADFDWDDLGDWNAVGRLLPSGDRENAVLGDGLAIDAAGCVLASDGHVSVLGVDDLVVASYDGRTLVVPRDRAQDVRQVVAELDEPEEADAA
ncbi:MAG: sugar phosphate nucleotidyltransferase [Haloarculaceae archaeon]